jgi:hypothetical protein
MSKEKQPHFFDQVIEAFGGYSPGGRVRQDGDEKVFEITRAAAARSGVADPDAVVAALNAQPLAGGIVRIALVDSDA